MDHSDETRGDGDQSAMGDECNAEFVESVSQYYSTCVGRCTGVSSFDAKLHWPCAVRHNVRDAYIGRWGDPRNQREAEMNRLLSPKRVVGCIKTIMPLLSTCEQFTGDVERTLRLGPAVFMFLALSTCRELLVNLHAKLTYIDVSMYVGHLAERLYVHEREVVTHMRALLDDCENVVDMYQLHSADRRLDGVREMIDRIFSGVTNGPQNKYKCVQFIRECSLMRSTLCESNRWIKTKHAGAYSNLDRNRTLAAKRLGLMKMILRRTPYASSFELVCNMMNVTYDDVRKSIDNPHSRLSRSDVMRTIYSCDTGMSNDHKVFLMALARLPIYRLVSIARVVSTLNYAIFSEVHTEWFSSPKMSLEELVNELDEAEGENVDNIAFRSKTIQPEYVMTVAYSHTMFNVVYNGRSQTLQAHGYISCQTREMRQRIFNNEMMLLPHEFNAVLPRTFALETIQQRITEHISQTEMDYFMVPSGTLREYCLTRGDSVHLMEDGVIIMVAPLTLEEVSMMSVRYLSQRHPVPSERMGIVLSTNNRTLLLTTSASGEKGESSHRMDIDLIDGDNCFASDRKAGALVRMEADVSYIERLIYMHLNTNAASEMENVDVTILCVDTNDYEFFDHWKNDITSRIIPEPAEAGAQE